MFGSEFTVTATYVLLFLVFGVFVSIVRKSDRRYRFFVPALGLKILGGLSFALIYKYYFGYGDTFGYFEKSLLLTQELQKDFWSGLKTIFYFRDDFGDYIYREFGVKSRLYSGQDTVVVIKFTALINLLTFSKFFATTIWFSFLSFLGMWYGYIKLTNVYNSKRLKLVLAVIFFFVPSIFFWGSGLMKDTVIIGFFWPLLLGLTPLTRLKLPKVSDWPVILISAYVVFTAKIFVVYCLIPGLVFMLYHQTKSQIRNRLLRSVVSPVLLFGLSTLSVFGALRLSTFSAKFNLETAFETAKIYQDYHLEQSEGGSAYSLSQFDNPVSTYVLNIPFAVNVTFFRPYVWEVNSLVMSLASLESLFLLMVFLSLLWRGGIRQNLRIIRSDYFLAGMLIFSLLMAYIVGFATYNFGTLVRYKIPCLMTMLVVFFVLDEKLREARAARSQLRGRFSLS